MGIRDEECEPKNNQLLSPNYSRRQMVQNIVIEDGAGGGGGASFVFLVKYQKLYFHNLLIK